MTKRYNLQDATTQRAIEEVRLQSEAWAAKELRDYQFVTENGSRDIDTVVGVKRLKHGLGRKLNGWMIVDIVGAWTSAIRVSTDSGDTADDRFDLWISFNTATTVRIIVF